MKRSLHFPLLLLGSTLLATGGETVFVEAESLAAPGGWTLDTQFIEIMGSPYLIAHGLGKPVADASGTVKVKTAGDYRVFARTKDWVAQWKAPGTPGKFQLQLDGQALPETLGTVGEKWHWQPAGKVKLTAGEHTLSLKDLTGFDGRCDAIVLTSDTAFTPPEESVELAKWRRQALALPAEPPTTEEYDLVVIGGGYSGMGSAISAARMGIKVALIQNRPVLGGNGSSEIQVWAQGGTRRGKYPHLGEIVEEFADFAKNSPGTIQEYGDAKKEAITRAEKNLSLFLNTHAVGVEMAAGKEKRITAVKTIDTRTGAETKFRGKFFADCTGHAYVAELAGASSRLQEKGHMGMSNMWKWGEAATTTTFPATPWALSMAMGDFPATQKAKSESEEFWKGEWFWESGFNLHPLQDLETTRDWNLRAVFGAFQAMKSGAEAEKFAKADLQWVAVIGGTRESRMVDGDILLTENDIVSQTEYPDGCVPTTWDIDLHYAKEEFAKKFPENPFISRAAFGKGVDKANGYPLPYRCFYSKNVANLFLAGRNISVTHEALGTIRVMRTCGMMGEVVGKAASLCVLHKTSPRGVYAEHLNDLIDLMKLPGAARRATVSAPLEIPTTPVAFPPSAGDKGRGEGGVGLKISKIQPGLVLDDNKALLEGKWSEGQGLPGFVGKGYRYAGPAAKAQAIYSFTVPQAGKYEVRVSWQPHENRATNTPCTISNGSQLLELKLNQKVKPTGEMGFEKVAEISVAANSTVALAISSEGANGNVHADCVWLLPVGK